MLFDLRARGRRRAIKVIYLFLAVLMGGGLVFFGLVYVWLTSALWFFDTNGITL